MRASSNSMTSFFEHQRTSFKKNYLRNLIALASADGKLDPQERSLIQAIGIRRGLKEWQVAELLEDNSNHEFFVPDTVGNRMNLLYDVMQIVYADGKVTENEIAFVKTVLSALKLEEEIMSELFTLFDRHTPSLPQWTDFIESVTETASRRFVTIL